MRHAGRRRWRGDDQGISGLLFRTCCISSRCHPLGVVFRQPDSPRISGSPDLPKSARQADQDDSAGLEFQAPKTLKIACHDRSIARPVTVIMFRRGAIPMTITVYTKPACVQCNATYKALDKKVSRTTSSTSPEPEARDYVMALGYLQAPVVVAGNDHWSGFGPTASRPSPEPRTPSAPSGPRRTHVMNPVGAPAWCTSPAFRRTPTGSCRSWACLPSGFRGIGRIRSMNRMSCCCRPTAGDGRTRPQRQGLRAQAGHRIFEQRAQPLSDPRRDRSREHPIRCRIRFAGTLVSHKCRVPYLYRFEMMGTPEDVEAVRAELAEFWKEQTCHQRSSC